MPINNSIINQKGTPAFYSDIFANRPAFGYAGRVFISTDTGAIYEDTGTAWTLIADAGAGTTGTLQQVTTNGSSTTVGLSTSGNGIGIGTTIPASNKLDIHSSSGINATFNGTGVTNAALQLQSAGTGKWNIQNLYNAGANSFQIFDVLNTTARLTILNTGATTLNGAFTSTSISITGGTSSQYLKADGSTSTLTNAVTGTGLGTQVALFSGTSTITGSVNLVFDSVNGRLGIGSSGTPAYQLDVTGNGRLTSSITASSFIKDTGTSAQILAADGSVITAGTNITISGGTIASSGGGSITLSAIGSTPNANAATLTGSALNLQPASASFGGVVTTGTQTFAGAKTFNTSITQTGTGSISIVPTSNIDPAYFTITNASGSSYFGMENSAGTVFGNGAYSRFWYNGGAYPLDIYTSGTLRMRYDSGGNIGIGTITIGSKLQVNGNAAIGYSASTTASSNGLQVNGRGNFLNATDNALFSLNSGGTLYTVGFSPTAQAISTNTYTILTTYTSIFYTGTGTATWTLPNPSGTNQMFYIKNAGTGIITLNAYAGTNIIDNTATSVSSITIAIGATALIQQDGNVKSYQLH